MFGATATAVAIAWQRKDNYAAIAILLVVTLCAGGLRELIAPYIVTAPGDPPLVGVARVLGHVDEALYLLDPFGLSAAAVYVYTGRRPWPALPGWAACVIALVVSYPWSREEHLRQVYLTLDLAALFVCVISLVSWARRREPMPLPQCGMGVLVVVNIVALVLGPYRFGFFSRWDLAQAAQLVAFGVLCLLQGGALCLRST
jgi:hypothetical protein